jgi:hypothetical protein
MLNVPLFIEGMLGMGDNIYQRAFVKQLPAGTYIRTAWPELYEDLPVLPVRSFTTLRTQRKTSTGRRPLFTCRQICARQNGFSTVRIICGAVQYLTRCASSLAPSRQN